MTASRTDSGARRAAAWLLIALPALLLLIFVAVYHVNGPFWDHVTSAEIFDRWHTGTFTLEFLFRQHNEHRTVVPRLAILALGSLTRWNNSAEMFAHWALMCGITAILFGAFRRDLEGRRPRAEILSLFVPISCLALSPRSAEALMGFGFPHYLSILFYVAALRILALGRPTAAWLAGAIVFGVATSFSLANGLLVWPVGVALLMSQRHERPAGQAVVPRAIAWAIAGTITIAGYFHGYVPPADQVSPWVVVRHPPLAMEHFVALNGSVFSPALVDALVFGTVMLGLDAYVIGRVLLDWRRDRVPIPFGAWLLATALASAASVTLHRATVGPRQALESRYTAMLALAPVGLYWCVMSLARTRPRLSARLAPPIVTLMLVGYMIASVDAWASARAWYSERSWAAYLLYSAKYQPDSKLRRIYANPDHVRLYSAGIERIGYNVFADPHVDPTHLTASGGRPDVTVDTINGHPPGPAIVVGRDDEIEVTGRAMNERSNGPPPALFFTIDGRQDLPAHPGVYTRGGPAPVFGGRDRWTGFTGSFAGFVLAPGEHTLAIKVVSLDGTRAYTTDPIARIVRR